MEAESRGVEAEVPMERIYAASVLFDRNHLLEVLEEGYEFVHAMLGGSSGMAGDSEVDMRMMKTF
jgi:hypothetical protein